MKKVLRAVGAGSVSAALVGVLALPAAYASTAENAPVSDATFAQALSTNSADIAIPASLPTAEELAAVEVPVVEEAASNARENTTEMRIPTELPRDLPSGAGAAGIVAAALAQVGSMDDCTDVVQNALAAAGYTTRRDQGGYDRGPGLGDWLPFGTQVSVSALAPGDIIVYSGSPHVAIYIGNGMAVHGGIYPTVVQTVGFAWGTASWAVRPH